MTLTSAAESPLQVAAVRVRYDRHQVSQNDQVLDAERTASGGDRDEHVKRRRVGPAKGQRVLDAVVVKEEHPVLTPVVADGEEQELSLIHISEPTRLGMISYA